MQKNEVLAPFEELFRNHFPNILMGMRLVANIEYFPEPTEEELKLQWFLNFQGQNFSYNKTQYKKWLLLKGFEDIHKAVSESLKNLLIYKKIKETGSVSTKDIEDIRKLHYPTLVEEVKTIYERTFSHEKELRSLNLVRNALVHDNGIALSSRLKKSGEDKFILYGAYPILFFQDGDNRTPVEIGKSGPAGAALMMGAEKFQIEFSIGDAITLSLKEFVNMTFTCIFIKADIEVMLESVDIVQSKIGNQTELAVKS